MSNFIKLVVVALLAFSFNVTAQEKFPASDIGMLPEPILVPSIADQIRNGTAKYADDSKHKPRPKGRLGGKVVPGKGLPKGADPLTELQKNTTQTQMRSPNFVFEADVNSNIPVTDPTGAAGINHYLAAWNIGFRIFDKLGNPMTPEMSLGTLFPGNTLGDPIVMFDANVDNGPGEPRGRFIVTEFRNGGNPGGNGFDVAVSAGPDPVNDPWFIYQAQFNAPAFPDYTKFAVWGDSYVVTANINNTSQRVFAVERNQMLQNLPAQFAAFPLPGIVAQGFYSPHGFHTSGDETVPPGTPAPIIFHQDDSFAGTTEDHLKIWLMTVDWANPANHSIALDQELFGADGVTPFLSVFDGGSFSNRPQPGGPDIDVLQNTVMNQVQYRRFGTHNSVVLNFVINTEGPGGELAGVRWYELRQVADGMPWSVYQEGTYNAPDGRDAYSASMVMNTEGDIAMAYTSSSATDMISIRYTGRQSDDVLNVMTSLEQLIGQSTAPNPGNRLADYVHMTIDPVDDSFWHIAEYFAPGRNNIVGNFNLLEAMPDDIGVISIDSPINGVLTNAETVEVTIRNFGTNDITDPMVQYSLDGVDAPAEMFSGTITPGTTVTHTFATPADLSVDGQTYTIVATTLLAGDSNTENDATTVMITNAVTVCEPISDCTFPDGVSVINLADQDITTECTNPGGYTDQTDIIFTFDPTDDTHDGIIQLAFGNSSYAIFIDFNDDGIFDSSELVAQGVSGAANTDVAITLDVSDFSLAERLGSHIMRVRGADQNNGTGDVTDPCGDLQFGRTNDFTAFFDPALNVPEDVFEGSDFVISTTDNNIFDINLTTAFEGRTAISVFNLSGQRIVFNNLIKEGNQFNYNLDMSYAATGVYIVQFDAIDGGSPIVAKILVK